MGAQKGENTGLTGLKLHGQLGLVPKPSLYYPINTKYIFF